MKLPWGEARPHKVPRNKPTPHAKYPVHGGKATHAAPRNSDIGASSTVAVLPLGFRHRHAPSISPDDALRLFDRLSLNEDEPL